MLTMPTKTVINRFRVFAATKKQGSEARKDLLFKPMEKPCSVISIPGNKRADNTATGMYLSHFRKRGGISNFDNITKGIIRGMYVTRPIPNIIKRILLSIVQ